MGPWPRFFNLLPGLHGGAFGDVGQRLHITLRGIDGAGRYHCYNPDRPSLSPTHILTLQVLDAGRCPPWRCPSVGSARVSGLCLARSPIIEPEEDHLRPVICDIKAENIPNHKDQVYASVTLINCRRVWKLSRT